MKKRIRRNQKFFKRRKTHAQKRAFERYQISLTKRQIKAIVNNILKQRRCQYLEKGHKNREIWRVNFKKKSFICVFSRKQNKIITFLNKSIYENLS